MIIRVSASHSLKKPNDASNTYAGSVESHVSYAIEEEYKGLTEAQGLAKAGELHKQLDGAIKLAVASSLDVGFVTDAEGYLHLTPVTVPSIPHVAAPVQVPAAYPPRQAAAGGSPRGGGQTGGRQYTAPKVDQSTLPILMLDYFGNGQPIAFVDRRGPKAQGVYAPNAADFQSVDKFTGKDGKQANIPIWLAGKDGSPQTHFVHLVAAAEAAAAQDEGRVF